MAVSKCVNSKWSIYERQEPCLPLCMPDPGYGGYCTLRATGLAGELRQVGPGLVVTEPLPTPLCRTTSLGGEGKEGSLLAQFYPTR